MPVWESKYPLGSTGGADNERSDEKKDKLKASPKESRPF